MDFTFGICAYQAESFILETLESIKYQINKYGYGIEVDLIIIDDCSQDNTVDYINRWLDINRALFRKTVLLVNEDNRGISFSYCRLLEKISTRFFLKIDGDDIIGSRNVFEQGMSIEENELKIFFPFRLKDEKLYVEEKDMIDMLYYAKKKHNHRMDLQLMATIKPFITPEVCLARKHFSKECLEFIQHYSQFEDDTSLYYVIKNCPDMIMKFCMEPMIIYRVHDRSLSNGESSMSQIRFLDDLHRFKKYLLMTEKNICTKYILFWAVRDTFLMKHRFGVGRSPYKRMNMRMYRKRHRKVTKDKEYADTINRIDNMLNEEMNYVAQLRSLVNEFTNRHLNVE